MATKHKGRFIVGSIEPADDAVEISGAALTGTTDVQGSLSPSGAGGDVLSGTDVLRRLAIGRVRVISDTDATLVVATDATSDIDGTLLAYAVPLAAARTVTLITTGAMEGMTWRVTRLTAATGVSGLDVGGIKTLAVGEWCEVTFSGSVWVLTAFGAL